MSSAPLAAAMSTKREPRSRRGTRALCTLGLVLSIALTGFPSPALASEGVAHLGHAGTVRAWLALALIVTAGLGLTARRRSRRRAVVSILALLVALFSVEMAVHSVHHALDDQAAASCALLGAAQHEHVAILAGVDAGAPDWTDHPPRAVEPEQSHPSQRSRPHDGRAPPSRPSA